MVPVLGNGVSLFFISLTLQFLSDLPFNFSFLSLPFNFPLFLICNGLSQYFLLDHLHDVFISVSSNLYHTLFGISVALFSSLKGFR